MNIFFKWVFRDNKVVGCMSRPPLQFLGEDSQIKLYMNLNLHHDLVNIWPTHDSSLLIQGLTQDGFY